MFEIRETNHRQAEDIEYLGTKRKYWFTADGKRYLFKAEERGTGEDWAEKVVCELANLLGIPHVNYELARDDLHPGNLPDPSSNADFGQSAFVKAQSGLSGGKRQKIRRSGVHC